MIARPVRRYELLTVLVGVRRELGWVGNVQQLLGFFCFGQVGSLSSWRRARQQSRCRRSIGAAQLEIATGSGFCCSPFTLSDQQRREECLYRRRVIRSVGGRQKCLGFKMIATVYARPKIEDVPLVLVFRLFRSDQQVSALSAVHPENGMTIGYCHHDGTLPIDVVRTSETYGSSLGQ